MADYAYFDSTTNRYVLGPPFIPAQENHPARETWNATFELEYWRYGLKTARRTGCARNGKIIANVEAPAESGSASQNGDRRSSQNSQHSCRSKDGVYLAHENCPQTFTERNKDHPSMLAALGVLRGEMVDRETMRRTLKKVMKEWDWPETWGWDYPMTAMTAARLNEPSIAIDALLLDTPKNKYSAERSQLSAAESAALSSRQRRSALRDRVNGQRMERRAKRKRTGLSARRLMDSSI